MPDDFDEFLDKVGKSVKSIFSLTPEEKREIKFRYLKENPKSFLGMWDQSTFLETLRAMCYLPSFEYQKQIAEIMRAKKETKETRELNMLLWAAINLYKELFPGGRERI